MLNFQLKTLVSLWENFFPTRADYRLISSLSDQVLLIYCQIHEAEAFTSLLTFNEPVVRAVVHEAKFHSNDKAWRQLGVVLNEYLKHYPSGTIVIPVPLSYQRQKSRGHNQVTMIAKAAGKLNPNVVIDEHTIFRGRHTKPQASLQRKERLKNVANAFGIRNHHLPKLKGKHIIILDDVATTGATLKAAKVALSPHLPKDTSLTCLALAH